MDDPKLTDVLTDLLGKNIKEQKIEEKENE